MADHDFIQPETATAVDLPDFIDIHYDEYEGETDLALLTDDGFEYRPIPFEPYFYLNEGTLTHSVCRILDTALDNHNDGDDVHVRDVETSNGLYHRISTHNPSDRKKLACELRNHGLRLFEADIPFERQVMINCEQAVTKPKRSLSFDIEVEAPDGVPDVLAANQRILSIAAVGSGGKEYTWAYDEEKRTIEEFLETARKYRCLIGWNSETFDYPYLYNRCQTIPGLQFNESSFVHLDALGLYREILTIDQPSYALDTVVEAEFDEQYGEDIDYSKLGEYFENDREKLCEYNLTDAEVVQRLNQRYAFVEVAFETLAVNAYVRPEDIFYVKQLGEDYSELRRSSIPLIEGAVMYETRPGGPTPTIWPTRGSGRSSGFIGGKVFDPDPGIYDNVAVIDFASMYPSIIAAFNISPETHCTDSNDGDIIAPIGSFVSHPPSAVSTALQSIQNEREHHKRVKSNHERHSPDWYVADGYDRGLKIYANSFYGVLGSGYSRLYNQSVAENVTRVGRYMLGHTARKADELGYPVRYGDTDSVLVDLGPDCEDPISESQQLAEILSASVREMLEQEYSANPGAVALDLDAVYSKLLLTEKKKRYAGIMRYDGGPCRSFERTGFKSARSDTPKAVREFQDELIKARLADVETDSIIESYRNRLYSGKIDDQLVTEKTLTKPVSEYKALVPHARVAMHRTDIGPGEVVPYIKYGAGKRDVAHPDELAELSPYAYDYLWTKLFESVITAVGVETP
jgi:DNA polymerase elongation subunit (family B)